MNSGMSGEGHPPGQEGGIYAMTVLGDFLGISNPFVIAASALALPPPATRDITANPNKRMKNSRPSPLFGCAYQFIKKPLCRFGRRLSRVVDAGLRKRGDT